MVGVIGDFSVFVGIGIGKGVIGWGVEVGY